MVPQTPPLKVLHLLSQRPSLTGSGVTLDALVRHAAQAGYSQQSVVAVPHDAVQPDVGGLPPAAVHPLRFGDESGDLDFPLPGMSDVMPYRSTRFSKLTFEQLEAYRQSWRAHLGAVVEDFRPDLIHTHHLWLLSSIIKQVSPEIPVVAHCHATGLRQLSLCPNLADEVRAGVRRIERFVALYDEQAELLAETVGLSPERITVVGAGYRDDLFNAGGRTPAPNGEPRRLAYAGKLSQSKGLPWLLDAVESLAADRPGLVLEIAGGGSGKEADMLRRRIESMGDRVRYHGRLDQEALAQVLRRCDLFVLPSFYEGLPLVLVEALACGCRLVCTELPAVTNELAHHLGDLLETVPLPRLINVDTPHPDDLPRFADDLAAAIATALDKPPLGDPAVTMPETLKHFSWEAVFRRVEQVWLSALD